MKYKVQATVSYMGEFEVEANSPQEAVDKFREKPTRFKVNNLYYNPTEIEDVFDKDMNLAEGHWE